MKKIYIEYWFRAESECPDEKEADRRVELMRENGDYKGVRKVVLEEKPPPTINE